MRTSQQLTAEILEILYEQGMEMLKIFKNHASKTSLLDDFTYHENHQKGMQEEKVRFIFKIFEPTHPNRSMNCLIELSPNKEKKIMRQNNSKFLKETDLSTSEQVTSNSNDPNLSVSEISRLTMVKIEDDIASHIKIGSLDINPKRAESKPLPDAATCTSSNEFTEVVTMGSVDVKINGFAESSSFLTVGTIPLDPMALQVEKSGAFPQRASNNN